MMPNKESERTGPQPYRSATKLYGMLRTPGTKQCEPVCPLSQWIIDAYSGILLETPQCPTQKPTQPGRRQLCIVEHWCLLPLPLPLRPCLLTSSPDRLWTRRAVCEG